MGASPLVSVIIPNYNYATYLGEAIESALGQSYPDVEVIVVDDGSTDGSEAVVRRYGERVRWLRQPRQGVSACRNLGVQVSRGALVAFLDADDCWLPRKLERQVDAWLAEPDLGLMHCGVRLIDEAGRPAGSRLDGLAGWIAAEMLLFRRPTILMAGSGALVPRETFDKVGGFDTRLSTSADWDFCYRVAVRQRVGFVPEELICVRMHGTNMQRDIRVMEHDMRLAYAKAFEQTGPEVRRMRRQCYGNLHFVLAASFFRSGQYAPCARHALASLWLTPTNAVRIVRPSHRYWWRQSSQTGVATVGLR